MEKISSKLFMSINIRLEVAALVIATRRMTSISTTTAEAVAMTGLALAPINQRTSNETCNKVCYITSCIYQWSSWLLGWSILGQVDAYHVNLRTRYRLWNNIFSHVSAG